MNRLRSILLLAFAVTLGTHRAAAQSSPTPADSAGGVRICAGGDVTLGTNLDTTWVATARARLGRRVEALPDPDSILEPFRPLLADADVVLWNVEGAVGDGPINRRKCAAGSTSCFAFRMPAGTARALRGVAADSAVVVGNVANNHARDDGDIGRRNTVRLLDAAGVLATGVDTLATEVVTARGDTLAVLGFAQWAGPDPRNLPAVRRHVRRAAERYGRVVVTMHMGAEGRGRQNTVDGREESFGEDRGNVVAFARAAVESGADLVIGHGPHVMRAIQWRDSALVFYSLGNLATYGPFTLSEPLNRGGFACAVLDAEGGIVGAELRSTMQVPPGVPRVDDTNRAAALADSLGQVDFPGTAARLDPLTGEIRRPDGSPLAPASDPSTGSDGERRRR
ncbi:CapA family protein [Longimicrobium sp.]|uniref:CapA family protein n=1 Tax=Longimicrobium sp. TaxID=2029185 RepID=UPI002E337D3F|nr:CapA family protein [Longimicrobium sp.]HEX6037799.1 CapA family protein [Longimicrobium sp.]